MKRLALKREQLAELTVAELTSVAGGAPPTLNVRECTSPTLDLRDCVASFDVHTCVDCITRWC